MNNWSEMKAKPRLKETRVAISLIGCINVIIIIF